MYAVAREHEIENVKSDLRNIWMAGRLRPFFAIHGVPLRSFTQLYRGPAREGSPLERVLWLLR